MPPRRHDDKSLRRDVESKNDAAIHAAAPAAAGRAIEVIGHQLRAQLLRLRRRERGSVSISRGHAIDDIFLTSRELDTAQKCVTGGL